jgi:methylenetetrahydrofolate reductase (NADPH)
LNTFEAALNNKDFVLTSEILLTPQSDTADISKQADMLRGHFDGVLVTDNQSGQLHMSSLAAAIMLKQLGVEPILQLSCRNRNRIAILGDLLGAGAHGIKSLQLVRGEKVPDGFKPRPKAVLDVTATELIATAHKMTGEEGIGVRPDFLLGGVVTIQKPKAGWLPRKLVQKVDAGAQFLITHPCLDIDLLQRYMKHLVSMKILHRVNIIIGTAVLTSAEDARWLRDNRFGVMIPKHIVKRLEQAANPRAEGIAICAEQLKNLESIPGVSGAHVIASSDLTSIPTVIEAAGLNRHPIREE